jgi:mRNA interferase YafQ
MRKAKITAQFEKDVRRAEKRGYEMQKLSPVIALLVREEPFEARHKDHPLKGNYAGARDCHIGPDWLLIYVIEGNELILLRTGTHSDLFE